jgi:D-alanyl-D-alanine carboxypeptidase
MDRKLTLLTIVIAILVLVNAYFFITTRNEPADAVSGPVINTAEAFIAPPSQVNYFPVLDANASDVKLDAKAAILYDVNADRNLFEKNIHQKLPIASLTKILNAVVAWEHFSPNEQVTIQSTAVKVDGERQDVYEGETLSVNNLLQMLLIESSNDAAYALRDYASQKGFDLVAEMNKKATDLGMHDTHFVDAAGLNDNGYSTPSDLVKAVRYALRYDALWSFSRQATATVTSADGKITREIKSTDQLLSTVSDIVGGKTGYTDDALGCMILVVHVPAAASQSDDTIIGVVLGSHSRFEDMKNLIDWARNVYHW